MPSCRFHTILLQYAVAPESYLATCWNEMADLGNDGIHFNGCGNNFLLFHDLIGSFNTF